MSSEPAERLCGIVSEATNKQMGLGCPANSMALGRSATLSLALLICVVGTVLGLTS